MSEVVQFYNAYVKCALWSTSATSVPRLDTFYSALHPDTRRQMIRDCMKFFTDNRSVWLAQCVDADTHPADQAALAGHDFWLGREGHVTGFWDGNWKEPAATHLSAAATEFGQNSIYVGDDELLHHDNRGEP